MLRLLGKWRTNWLAIAAFATVAYLIVLFVVLIPLTAPCGNDQTSLITRYLTCLSANELGDFLAGAFAPIAFLWLVAAVLIQSQELRAQREELTLTRQELASSREVMKEQAEQAKNQAIQAQRQADFIGEQTENFKRQSEDHYREQQDRIFEETLHALHQSTLSPLSRHPYKIPTDQGTMIGSFSDFRNMDPNASLFELRKNLVSLDKSLESLQPDANWPIQMGSFTPLIVGIEKLLAMESQISPSYVIKLASLGLNVSKTAAQSIVEKYKAREDAEQFE